MRHYIDGNKYYIVGINGETLFSLTLTDEAGNQVVIEGYATSEVENFHYAFSAGFQTRFLLFKRNNSLILFARTVFVENSLDAFLHLFDG